MDITERNSLCEKIAAEIKRRCERVDGISVEYAPASAPNIVDGMEYLVVVRAEEVISAGLHFYVSPSEMEDYLEATPSSQRIKDSFFGSIPEDKLEAMDDLDKAHRIAWSYLYLRSEKKGPSLEPENYFKINAYSLVKNKETA